ncbi:transposase [Leptospira alstonii]|uniref:transposase n=1 Tax=Leptospira alstonii TaxID=28452 RepID=UPI0009EB696B
MESTVVKKQKTQDYRKLRKYRHRWKVERTFAWLQIFRGFNTRHERNDQNFYGILILACILIVIRYF